MSAQAGASPNSSANSSSPTDQRGSTAPEAVEAVEAVEEVEEVVVEEANVEVWRPLDIARAATTLRTI